MFRSTTRSPRPALHRRFIAVVLAASVAVTGFTAAPARADEDFGKILAGLAAIAIIGAAIENSRDDNVHVVTRQKVRVKPYKGHNHAQPHNHDGPRNLPPRVARYDLPGKCVQTFRAHNGTRVLGLNCLKNNYRHVGSLPKACRLSVDKGRKQRVGYETLCLRERGYRITRS